MKCPECSGNGYILTSEVPDLYKKLICSSCDGSGEAVDRFEFPNNCPACGEPVRAWQKWCEMHKGAEGISLE